MIFKVRWGVRGNHVHLAVFVGPDRDHLALAGELRLRLEEFPPFMALLECGGMIAERGKEPVKVIFEHEGGVSQ